MEKPTISIDLRNLERMFGALEIGSIENDPLSFKLVPVNQNKWAAGWHIIGLIFLNVISLIAYVILVALRNKLIIDLKNYNDSLKTIPIQEDVPSQPTKSLQADPVETGGSIPENCDIKMEDIAKAQGYFYYPSDGSAFSIYIFIGDINNPRIVENSHKKIHITVEQSDKNMLKALPIIVNTIKKGGNTFKIVNSQYRTKDESENLAGKVFTVYLTQQQTEEDALAMARELNEALTKGGIIPGPCSLADIPIFDNGFIYSRQPNSIDSQYVDAKTLMNWGFTRYEASTIGLENSLFGKNLSSPPEVQDFRKIDKKKATYPSMDSFLISDFLIRIFKYENGEIAKDFLAIFCPSYEGKANEPFYSLFQEVQSHFYSVFNQETPMGKLYPALYHAIIKPLAKLGIMDISSEERIGTINNFLKQNKDSIVKYLLDCAMRTKDAQIFTDKPIYKSL